MTRLRPLPPPPVSVDEAADFRALGAPAVALALALVVAEEEAARFLGAALVVSSGGAGLADFRATMSSYPTPVSPFRSPADHGRRCLAAILCDCSSYVN